MVTSQPAAEAAPIAVLFVCLGNICRSPSAEAIFRQRAERRGWARYFHIASCGTAAFNQGHAADPRARAACERRGYDLSGHCARQILDEDFERFDYLLAMDQQNLSSLQAWQTATFSGTIALLRQYEQSRGSGSQIGDPYYQQGEVFDSMVSLLERCCDGLLDHLQPQLAAGDAVDVPAAGSGQPRR